jgi:hypothetical protein
MSVECCGFFFLKPRRSGFQTSGYTGARKSRFGRVRAGVAGEAGFALPENL